MDEVEIEDIDKIAKTAISLREVTADFIHNIIAVIIVVAVVVLAIKNNNIDILLNPLNLILGYYIAKRGV